MSSKQENKEYSLEWYKEHEGDIIAIDDNYCECAQWEIGTNRCMCGNRRIYLDDLFGEGIYYPMAD